MIPCVSCFAFPGGLPLVPEHIVEAKRERSHIGPSCSSVLAVASLQLASGRYPGQGMEGLSAGAEREAQGDYTDGVGHGGGFVICPLLSGSAQC